MRDRKFQEYVVGFAFSKDFRSVLLIKKNKPKWQEGKYNGVGGKVEGKEDYWKAMTREFQEEVGLETKEKDWRYVLDLEAPDEAVAVFAGQFDYKFLNRYKQMESEVPFIVPVLTVTPFSSAFVDNLKWIIPFCIRTFEKGHGMCLPVYVKYEENAE